jgi:hypothetical protein
MIDSKPVQPPYLSLVPFKNFGKANQALGLHDDSKIKGKNDRKWDKELEHDLEHILEESAP